MRPLIVERDGASWIDDWDDYFEFASAPMPYPLLRARVAVRTVRPSNQAYAEYPVG